MATLASQGSQGYMTVKDTIGQDRVIYWDAPNARWLEVATGKVATYLPNVKVWTFTSPTTEVSQAPLAAPVGSHAGVGAVQTKFKECHKGNVLCFQYNGIDVFGGGSSRAMNIYDVDFVVGLSRGNGPDISANFTLTHLSRWVPKYLLVEISDGSAPEYLTQEFWWDLWSEIEESGAKSVLVHCVGGHGRTGMVLAILVGLLLGEKEPIKFVRENYCDEAVETEKQIKYVGRMTDTKEDVQGRSYITTHVTNFKGGSASGGVISKSAEDKNVWSSTGSWDALDDESWGTAIKTICGPTKKQAEDTLPFAVAETPEEAVDTDDFCQCYDCKCEQEKDCMCYECALVADCKRATACKVSAATFDALYDEEYRHDIEMLKGMVSGE